MPFHSGYGYYGTGDWLWSIFSTALFIVLVTLAIMLLVRAVSSRQHGPGGAARPGGGSWSGPPPADPRIARPAWGSSGSQAADSGGEQPGGEQSQAAESGGARSLGAEGILAERYARGEISEEEYRGRLQVLRQAAAGWRAPEPLHPTGSPQSMEPPRSTER